MDWTNKKVKQYGTEPYWLGVLIYVRCHKQQIVSDMVYLEQMVINSLKYQYKQ